MVMDADGRTLSQKEIDAMLNATARRDNPKPHSATNTSPPAAEKQAVTQATPAPPTASPTPSPIANQGVDPNAIAALAQRVAAIEESIGRLSQIESTLAPLQAAGIPKMQDFQALVNYVKKVAGQVETITQSLQNTPGAGVRSNFQCTSCGTQNTVVSLFKCSKCGKDHWLGWWPQK